MCGSLWRRPCQTIQLIHNGKEKKKTDKRQIQNIYIPEKIIPHLFFFSPISSYEDDFQEMYKT